MTIAVRHGNILIQPHTIQIIILYHLIVRQDIPLCQPQPPAPAAKAFIHCLPRFLRLNINHVGTVHGACTNADNYPPKALQLLTQPDCLKKMPLGWHMTTSQKQYIIAMQILTADMTMHTVPAAAMIAVIQLVHALHTELIS